MKFDQFYVPIYIIAYW